MVINGFIKKKKTNFELLNAKNSNILKFVMYGLLAETVINLYKPFGVMFIKRLGGTDFDIALYYALPGIMACLFLIPGSYFISKCKSKKDITTILFFCSRFTLLLLAFVPFLSDSIQALVFVILIGVMNIPDSLSQNLLQRTIGNSFEPSIRPTALTLKSKFGYVALIFVSISTSLILTFLPKTNEERILWYQFFYLLAFFVGIFEIIQFRKIKEIKNDYELQEENINISDIALVFKNKKFMLYCFTTCFFLITWMSGWPLTSMFQINYLGANEFWIAIFGVSSALGSFSSAGFWRNYINKNGNQKSLVLATFCIGITYSMYVLIHSLYTMPLLMFVTGFSLVGVLTTTLNGLIEASPDDNKLMYLATYNTMYNICLFVSPMIGYFLQRNIGLHLAMSIIGLSRFVSCFFIYIFYIKYYKDNKKNNV